MVREETSSGGDQQSVVVSRDEVRARDVTGVLEVLTPLLTDAGLARRSLEAVVIAVDGYDDRAEDLWEIPEVRSYLQHLDAQFPYWFYFLDKQDPGLFAIVRSVLPVEFSADKLGERLTDWWLPAMEQATQFADLDDEIADVLIQRSLAYLRHGPGELVTPALPELAGHLEESAGDGEPGDLRAGEVMGDLSRLLPELPSTWRPGSENELLVWLWSVLKEKGLVRRQTQVEHVRSVASLLALHRLKTLFYAHAFGEGDSEDSYVFPSADFVDDYPKAEPFWIGVHSGADATFDALIDPAGGPDWSVAALNDLARGQYDEIVSMLRRILGENVLFTALLTSSTNDARYPVPDAVVDEVMDGDLDSLGDAWDWLREQGR
jgi:hypothetical protein